jgi:signal transduction histidine kinase
MPRPALLPASLRRTDLVPAALLVLLLASSGQLPGTLQCLSEDGSLGACLAGVAPGWGIALASLGFMLLALLVARRWLHRPAWGRLPSLAAQTGAVALSTLLVMGVLSGDLGRSPPSAYLLQLLLTDALCLVVALDFLLAGREQAADAARLQRDTAQRQRELDEARLQMLQAQVEPHFLFNTLAHLRRLAHTDPAEARAMLADLLRYLEEALPNLRSERTTLGHELSLVRAYLALHQRRLGQARLRWSIDTGPGLDDLPLPANSLLTLVENALKHGIAPQVGGGFVHVSARREGHEVVLSVADTGRGMGESSGTGTGLATLRARLAAQHGPEASLSLRLNQPQGLVATLRWTP